MNRKRMKQTKARKKRITKIIRNGLHHLIYVYVGHFSADVKNVVSTKGTIKRREA